MIDQTEQIEEQGKKLHGKLYWIGHNIFLCLRGLVHRHLLIMKILAVIAVITAFVFRSAFQPWVLALRDHTFDILLIALCILGFKLLGKRLAEKGKRLSRGWKVLTFIAVFMIIRVQAYDYMERYFRHRALNELDLEEMPLTDYERIQPMVSLRELANGVMDQNMSASDPDFVRIGNDYRFTMAIEPSTTISRLTGKIGEVIDIPGKAAAPDFSKESRHQVNFAVGENMLFSKNTSTATIRSFGLLRYFSYKPSDVRYIKNDQGEIVQVVSLVRLGGSWWSQWIFPWPEFGGVHVIKQSQGGYGQAIKRFLVGEGEWIAPEDISKYPYLRGQNLVPYEVSRYAAESFRYDQGLFAPLYHKGDTRIPEMPEDENPQPFTIYAKFNKVEDERNKLYHYFALEPRQASQHGLAVSLFFPADGIGQPLAYRHFIRNEGLHGVAVVDSQVRGSDLHVDWSHARPVEHRPWIRDVGKTRRLMWLSTIVTFREGPERRASASSTPSTVLTDARTGQSFWVKATDLDSWLPQVEKEFVTDTPLETPAKVLK